jgi:hypothetical protein
LRGLLGGTSYFISGKPQSSGNHDKRTSEYNRRNASAVIDGLPKPDNSPNSPIDDRARLYAKFWEIVGFVVAVSVFLSACYFLGGWSARRAHSRKGR